MIYYEILFLPFLLLRDAIKEMPHKRALCNECIEEYNTKPCAFDYCRTCGKVIFCNENYKTEIVCHDTDKNIDEVKRCHENC